MKSIKLIVLLSLLNLFLVILTNSLSNKEDNLQIKGHGIMPFSISDNFFRLYLMTGNHGNESMEIRTRTYCCCLDIGGSETDCKSMNLTGRGKHVLNPGETANLTLIYKNKYIIDRVGECIVYVDYGDGHLQHSIQFNTTIPVHIGANAQLSFLKELVPPNIPRCSGIDEDRLHYCRPVDCRAKYQGNRNYYNRTLASCQPTVNCSSARLAVVQTVVECYYGEFLNNNECQCHSGWTSLNPAQPSCNLPGKVVYQYCNVIPPAEGMQKDAILSNGHSLLETLAVTILPGALMCLVAALNFALFRCIHRNCFAPKNDAGLPKVVPTSKGGQEMDQSLAENTSLLSLKNDSVPETEVLVARVHTSFTPIAADELPLRTGDIICRVEKSEWPGFWKGECKGRIGVFSEDHVLFYKEREEKDQKARIQLFESMHR